MMAPMAIQRIRGNLGQCSSYSPEWRSNCPPSPGNKTVDREHDDRAYNGADEAGALARLVPIERLPEIGGNERAHDAQDGRQDEARRLIVSRHEELGDDAGQKSDDDGPEDAHCACSLC